MTTDTLKKFDAKLKQCNQQLKADCVRATITRKGHALYVRATLPPKPNRKEPKPFQQYVPLDAKATLQGLKRAKAEAKKIGAALDLKEFDWTDYRLRSESKPDCLTVADWSNALTISYFENRKRNLTTERTFKDKYQVYLKRLPQDQLLTKELLEKAIKATEPDSQPRSAMCFACQVLGKFAAIDVSFIDRKLRGTYSSHKPAPRNLPSDDQIVEWFPKILNPKWRWAYGMMATYGLRPHELYHLDMQDLEQGGYVLKVLDRTKTGYREVHPYHPEWVDQFGLRQRRFPVIDVFNQCNKYLGSKISAGFRRYKVPFRPYNLRHCYAVRCMRFGLDPALAALQMGHTVAVHTTTYHAWISRDIKHEAFLKSIQNPNRPKPPAIPPPSQQVVDSELAA